MKSYAEKIKVASALFSFHLAVLGHMVSTQLSDHVQVFWPRAVFAKFQARGGPNTLVDLDVSARSFGDLTALSLTQNDSRLFLSCPHEVPVWIQIVHQRLSMWLLLRARCTEVRYYFALRCYWN